MFFSRPRPDIETPFPVGLHSYDAERLASRTVVFLLRVMLNSMLSRLNLLSKTSGCISVDCRKADTLESMSSGGGLRFFRAGSNISKKFSLMNAEENRYPKNYFF